MTKLNLGASLLFAKTMAHLALISEAGTTFTALVPGICGLVLVFTGAGLAIVAREIAPLGGPDQID